MRTIVQIGTKLWYDTVESHRPPTLRLFSFLISEKKGSQRNKDPSIKRDKGIQDLSQIFCAEEILCGLFPHNIRTLLPGGTYFADAKNMVYCDANEKIDPARVFTSSTRLSSLTLAANHEHDGNAILWHFSTSDDPHLEQIL